jgi:hypothetical protein
VINDIKIIKYAIGFIIDEILAIEDLLAEGKGIAVNDKLTRAKKEYEKDLELIKENYKDIMER